MCAKSLQSCPTLGDPMDCSPPGSSVHGILQARILDWLPFPSPGNLSNPGIESRSPALQADSLPSEPILSSYKAKGILPFATIWLYQEVIILKGSDINQTENDKYHRITLIYGIKQTQKTLNS